MSTTLNQNELAEGLFYVAIMPLIGNIGGPGVNIGFGNSIIGIAALHSEFAVLEPELIAIIKSTTLSQNYVANCLRQQQQTAQDVRNIGKTLSETSDIIMQGWENRNRTDDILSQQRSDAILGRERLYDPSTGQVYEFDNGFYDAYNLNRHTYFMNNLQPLPNDNYELWMAPALNGPQNLH